MKGFLLVYVIILIGLFAFWNIPEEKTEEEKCEESVHSLPVNLYSLPTSAQGVWRFCGEEENREWIKKLSKVN